MNRSGRANWIAGAIGIAFVAAIAQGAHLPDILSGPNLRIVSGAIPDPHLLTAWLDQMLVHGCALNGACVHTWNALAFALVVAVAGITAVLAAGATSRAIALLATGVAAFSVLAAPLIVDPLGLAMILGGALIALAAVDATDNSRYPLVARCVLAIAVGLQDPLLAPAAVAYGAVCAVRSGRGPLRFAPLLCAMAVVVARVPALLQAHFDPLAGPATIVIAGIAIFVAGPLIIVLNKRNVFGLIDARASALGPGLILAGAAVLAGAFSPGGDPAPYWLAGEVALIAALYQAVPHVAPERLRNLLVLFCIAFGLQFWVLVGQHDSNTSVIVADQGAALRSFLDQKSSERCVVSDSTGLRFLLADGAFQRIYKSGAGAQIVADATGCFGLPDTTQLATIDGLYVTDYGAMLPLWRLARAAPSTGVLAVQDGEVWPKTVVKTPTGTGSFGNAVATPLGPVGDFTLLSGFAYTPQCLPVGIGKHLSFAVSSIPGSPALTFAVDVRGNGGTRPLYRHILAAAPADAPTQWQNVSIPVRAARCEAFTFSVGQPAGERFNYWVTFAGASVQ